MVSGALGDSAEREGRALVVEGVSVRESGLVFILGGFKFQVQRVNDGAVAHRLPGAWQSSRHFRGRVFSRWAMAFNSRWV